MYRGAIHKNICEISVGTKNLFFKTARIVNLFPGYSDIPLKKSRLKRLNSSFRVYEYHLWRVGRRGRSGRHDTMINAYM